MTTNTDINELARQLREAAEEVSPQNIDSAQAVSDTDGYIECPHCSGEGTVNLEADYCNYDELPIGVQFYGIGTGVGAAERYFRAASPNNITVILDALEAAQKNSARWFNAFHKAVSVGARYEVRIAELEASQPVVTEYIGLSVSVDVSTSEENAGHRYFGRVSSVQESDNVKDKNGVVLLVQDDIEANFNELIAPDGWKLVPVEPTPDMIAAGDECWMMTESCTDSTYRAMLNAAPAIESQGIKVK